MQLYTLIAVLITLAALFDFINYHFFRLPRTIGLMTISLAFSLIMVVLGKLFQPVQMYAESILTRLDFSAALMNGMLSFLLFAGALHIDLGELKEHAPTIAAASTLGVVLSTVLTALFCYGAFMLIGLNLPLVYCFAFGALISPTDPIAVLSIMRTSGVARALRTEIAGESLFNDGVGVVVFTTITSLLAAEANTGGLTIAAAFAWEAGGGILLGIAAGYLTYRMLRTIDEYNVEIFLTLALVTGGYTLALLLHVSGPLAIVAAGILIGNTGRRFGMSSLTRQHLDGFWAIIDEILNAILFVMIGLELLIIGFSAQLVAAGMIAVGAVLAARFFSLALLLGVPRISAPRDPHSLKIMTWAGLRGGISIALALSLRPGSERAAILALTYCVVIFSISVQGLTMKPLVAHLRRLSGETA